MHAFRLLILLTAFLFPAITNAGQKKQSNLLISFHVETDSNENPKMIFSYNHAGKQKSFRRMPDIATKDLAAYSPFPAEDGSFGVVFLLKPTAKSRLESITIANQGSLLASAINGHITNVVKINEPITDGTLVIWQGWNEVMIKELDKTLPRIGEDSKKKK